MQVYMIGPRLTALLLDLVSDVLQRRQHLGTSINQYNTLLATMSAQTMPLSLRMAETLLRNIDGEIAGANPERLRLLAIYVDDGHYSFGSGRPGAKLEGYGSSIVDRRGEAPNILWRMRGKINRVLNQGGFSGVVTGTESDKKLLGAPPGDGG